MADPDVTGKPRARTSRAGSDLMTGFVMSEDADFRLGTMASAMRGIARLIEGDESGREVPELPAEDLAAIFRTMAEAAGAIRAGTAHTLNEVPVRPRDLH